jgi:hypothetical protein
MLQINLLSGRAIFSCVCLQSLWLLIWVTTDGKQHEVGAVLLLQSRGVNRLILTSSMPWGTVTTPFRCRLLKAEQILNPAVCNYQPFVMITVPLSAQSYVCHELHLPTVGDASCALTVNSHQLVILLAVQIIRPSGQCRLITQHVICYCPSRLW